MIVAAWAGLIFALIPMARSIQGFVSEHLGRTAFLTGVALALTGIFAAGIYKVWRKRDSRIVQQIWGVAFPLVAFAVWGWEMRSSPEHAVHFLQYGVLSLLLLRALLNTWQDSRVYLYSIFGCFLIGTFDELIQSLTPGRVFDFLDIAINTGSGALMQFGVAFGIRPTVVTFPGWNRLLVSAVLLGLVGVALTWTLAFLGIGG